MPRGIYLRPANDCRRLKRSRTMDLMGSYQKWRKYRRTLNELNGLSTRELNDLGISRGDIPFVARGGKRRS